MKKSISITKKLRKGSTKDPYCINVVKICMEQNQSDKQTLETLLSFGISMNQRMLTRIKQNIREFQNLIENNQYPPREQIRSETVYLINEQIQQLLHLESATGDENTKIKAANMIANFLLQRLKIYRFPLHD